MSRSAMAGLSALALLGLVLTACATPTANPGQSPDQTDGQETIAPDPDLGAAWLDNGRMIGLVTLGSSSCPPQAEKAEVVDGVLQVALVAPDGDQPCTADLAPRVTLVGVPEDVDPEENLSIEVTGDEYFGEVELAGVAGLTGGGETDYLPSAGWATVQGQFVILTWGSSSCPPVIQDVAATGPAEVTVTYETAPDQPCTMDMAPRAAVTAVNGLEESFGVEAILTGGEFDNIKIPVYGTNG